MADARHVLVVAPNWLGDAVMALPAIADLRRHYRDGRLTVAARGAVVSLFALVPGIDDVIALQWRGGALRRAERRADAIRLKEAAIDTAILFTNSFATAWLLKEAQIPERWGYAADMRTMLLSRAIPKPRRSVHQGEYYQHLVRALGVPSGPLEPEVDVPAAAVAEARRLLLNDRARHDRTLIVLAPGAAYGTAKRWLPSHFATLISQLTARGDTHCVLVGSAADAATTREIAAMLAPGSRMQVTDLAGATTLEGLTAVLTLAKVCIANDSGAMHLAAAAGTPVVALFGPTRDRETAPLARGGQVAEVLINPVWCRPCMLRECPIDHRCMRGLAPSRVFESVEAILARPGRVPAGEPQ
jgi:heptosyltransferase-2